MGTQARLGSGVQAWCHPLACDAHGSEGNQGATRSSYQVAGQCAAGIRSSIKCMFPQSLLNSCCAEFVSALQPENKVRFQNCCRSELQLDGADCLKRLELSSLVA